MVAQSAATLSRINPATTGRFRDDCGAQDSGGRYRLCDVFFFLLLIMFYFEWRYRIENFFVCHRGHHALLGTPPIEKF
jgi:hypothetical protein